MAKFKKGDKVLINTWLEIKGEIISFNEKDIPIVKVKFEGINEPIEVSIDSISLADEETSSKIRDKRLSHKEYTRILERQMELMGISKEQEK